MLPTIFNGSITQDTRTPLNKVCCCPSCRTVVCPETWNDRAVQGQSRVDRELLDAQVMVGELVPQGSVFAFLAEHRHELFPDSFIADLFRSSTGRPSLPADLVGSVLVLKELFDLSDTQTAEALKFDIRWKVACGRSLTAMSFDPSTLVYWRRRIAASERPDRVFDAVAEVITETGILTGRRNVVWIRRYSTTRSPPRTPSPSWWPRSARWRGWCPVRRRSSAGSPRWTTRGRANQRSTGTIRRPSRTWCRTWSTTRWRCWSNSPGRTPRSARTRRRMRWGLPLRCGHQLLCGGGQRSRSLLVLDRTDLTERGVPPFLWGSRPEVAVGAQRSRWSYG
ncbi:transposase [Rhodococcus opacus]|nr:transposase [Rhodococcus opacus]